MAFLGAGEAKAGLPGDWDLLGGSEVMLHLGVLAGTLVKCYLSVSTVPSAEYLNL